MLENLYGRLTSTVNGWKTGRAWTVKLFILGLPGSGKSSVARIIDMYARDGQWSTTHISDYAILYRMFQEDTKGQFKPVDFVELDLDVFNTGEDHSTTDAWRRGFDVLDLSVFDTALEKLEQEVNEYISSANSERLLLIEFSRNDYQKAFHKFSYEFLQDAYFLYLDAEISTCKQRIRNRIAKPIYEDDHYVSDYIFEEYYHGDNGQCLSNILERDYMLDKQRVLVIDNDCSLEDASERIVPFIDYIISSSSILKDRVDISSSSLEGSVTNEVVNTSVNNPGQSMSDDTSVSPKVLDENTSNLELLQI